MGNRRLAARQLVLQHRILTEQPPRPTGPAPQECHDQEQQETHQNQCRPIDTVPATVKDGAFGTPFLEAPGDSGGTVAGAYELAAGKVPFPAAAFATAVCMFIFQSFLGF